LALLPLLAEAQQTVTSTETVIRLTVQPMAAPKPALRYLLLPELKEMNPGNPIANYLRCLMDHDVAADRETFGRAALRQADWAARLDKPDWQILLKLKTDGIGLLLPDVQKIRSLAAALKDRFHDEAATRRFDDALRTAKTMFAMSRHMGEHPTLIGDLVGIAIAFVTIGPLEEMLEQPGCPNLYWALTNLPSPLISVDKGVQGERLLFLSEFPDLDDSAPMSTDQLKKLIAHIDKVRAFDDKPVKKTTRRWLDARTRDEKLLSAARRRLVEVDLPEERVNRFPADQVILLDERREHEVRRDEIMKLMNLPTWQIDKLAAQAKPAKEPALFDLFVPAVLKVRHAQGRLEQRIALLRHVEGLRMYAAAHDGRLPAKLADVPVPLPDDPFTGKPFEYKVDGATAHLRGSPPRGEKKNPGYNIHYEITFRK
jgi:hypothetical protein